MHIFAQRQFSFNSELSIISGIKISITYSKVIYAVFTIQEAQRDLLKDKLQKFSQNQEVTINTTDGAVRCKFADADSFNQSMNSLLIANLIDNSFSEEICNELPGLIGTGFSFASQLNLVKKDDKTNFFAKFLTEPKGKIDSKSVYRYYFPVSDSAFSTNGQVLNVGEVPPAEQFDYSTNRSSNSFYPPYLPEQSPSGNLAQDGLVEPSSEKQESLKR